MRNVRTIRPEELEPSIGNRKLDLLDVRTPAEYREVHASGARNSPLESLDPMAVSASRTASAEEPLYVLCKSGSRGAKACREFAESGFDNVINVEGGTDAWIAAGLPVVRGKASVSLERQVRIAAGLLAFVGGVLGVAIHPYFAAISAFVGAGLMFAGITDSCAMGMLLARMPWNRVKSDAATCEAPRGSLKA